MSNKILVDAVCLVGFAGIAFEHWIGGVVIVIVSGIMQSIIRGKEDKTKAEQSR